MASIKCLSIRNKFPADRDLWRPLSSDNSLQDKVAGLKDKCLAIHGITNFSATGQPEERTGGGGGGGEGSPLGLLRRRNLGFDHQSGK